MRINLTKRRTTSAHSGPLPNPLTREVRPVGADEFPEAAEVLVRAFFNFSLNQYLFPDPKKRAHQLRFIYLRTVELYRGVGGAFITDDGSGVALWTPPQFRHGVGLWRYLQVGFLSTPFHIGWEMPLRRIGALRDIERRRRAEIREPFWSLEVIGADPERQRTGSGTALIRHVLDQADEQGLPAYVITHEARNVAYYERFGFRLVGDAPFEPGAPPTCSLLRAASAKL
jgi:GNAT superfamily N-acetyltransferase